MRRGWAIALAIVAVLAIVGVAFGAYHAGVDEGIRRTADGGQVVEVVGGYGWHGGGFGFFPFGLILFPLFLFGIFALLGGAFRRGPWGGHHDHGPWRTEGGRRFEDRFSEWHDRQHQEGSSGGAVSRSEGRGPTGPDPGSGSTM